MIPRCTGITRSTPGTTPQPPASVHSLQAQDLHGTRRTACSFVPAVHAAAGRRRSHHVPALQVIGQLKGDTPLPWEGSRSSKLLQQLGMLRSPVLRLLERVPAHRASAKQFHNACNKAFADQAVVDV